MATFLISIGDGAAELCINLQPGQECEFGRTPPRPIESDVMRYEFLNPALSRRHARIGCDTDGLYIMDVGTNGCGSTNGTYIQDGRISAMAKVRVQAFDEIWLGPPGNVWSIKIVVGRGSHISSQSTVLDWRRMHAPPLQACDEPAQEMWA